MNRIVFLARTVLPRVCGSFIITLLVSCSSSVRFTQSDHRTTSEFIQDGEQNRATIGSNDLRRELSNFARTFIGTPYCLGGTSKSCFDCSGFIQTVYRHVGIPIPRTTTEMAAAASFRRVELQDAQVGDLLFFDFDHVGSASHVGLYLGSGTMIHASTSRGVVIDDVLSGPIAASLRFVTTLRIDEY